MKKPPVDEAGALADTEPDKGEEDTGAAEGEDDDDDEEAGREAAAGLTEGLPLYSVTGIAPVDAADRTSGTRMALLLERLSAGPPVKVGAAGAPMPDDPEPATAERVELEPLPPVPEVEDVAADPLSPEGAAGAGTADGVLLAMPALDLTAGAPQFRAIDRVIDLASPPLPALPEPGSEITRAAGTDVGAGTGAGAAGCAALKLEPAPAGRPALAERSRSLRDALAAAVSFSRAVRSATGDASVSGAVAGADGVGAIAAAADDAAGEGAGC